MMAIFNVVFGEVGNVMAGIGQQAQIISQLTDSVKGCGPKSSSIWTGADADAFRQEIISRLVPAFLGIFSMVGTINTNLTKAMDIVRQADQQTQQLANQVNDIFNQIF